MPPHRRTAAARVLLLLLAVSATLVLALSGCSLGGDDASLPEVGEPAANEAMSVTVDSIAFYDEITSDSGNVVRPESKRDVYVIVDLTLRNTQDAPIQVDPQNVQLVREGGDYKSGAGAEVASLFPKEFKPLKAKPLAPGKKTSGMVAYSFTKGTLLDKVVYDADPDIEVGLNGQEVRAPAPEKLPRIGQAARGGGLSFKVKSITYPDSLTHGLWTTTAKKGSKLVVVDVTVKNLDYRPSHKVEEWNVILIDQRGDQHITGIMGVLGMADSEKLDAKRIKPGKGVSGKVVFGIKKKLNVKRVRYAVGVMGPPVEVAATK